MSGCYWHGCERPAQVVVGFRQQEGLKHPKAAKELGYCVSHGIQIEANAARQGAYLKRLLSGQLGVGV